MRRWWERQFPSQILQGAQASCIEDKYGAYQVARCAQLLTRSSSTAGAEAIGAGAATGATGLRDVLAAGEAIMRAISSSFLPVTVKPAYRLVSNSRARRAS